MGAGGALVFLIDPRNNLKHYHRSVGGPYWRRALHCTRVLRGRGAERNHFRHSDRRKHLRADFYSAQSISTDRFPASFFSFLPKPTLLIYFIFF